MIRKEYVAITILTLLNIIIHYPITPHELGDDSFFIHNTANSILDYSYAKWIIHPLSFFGLYPYSYASGVPYLLAIYSLISGLEMETTIYIISLSLGILGMFAAYVMAGEFINNFYFKSLVAFIFSTSPLALKFTIWTVSTRGMFLMLLPLFIWCLLNMYKKYQHRYLFLSALFFISLASAHKMFVLTLLVIIAYLFAIILPRITKKAHLKLLPHMLLLLFIFLFFVQFSLIKSWWTLKFSPFHGSNWYYLLIGLIFEMLARYGFLTLFTLTGLIVILFKNDRSEKDWFLIITVLLFTPLLSHSMYFYEALLTFFSLLSAFGILYLIKLFDRFINQRYSITFILIALICFSLFTLRVRYTNTDPLGYSNHMYASTYSLAKFIQKDTGNRPISGVEMRRVSAIVTNPTSSLSEPDYFIYNLIDKQNLNIQRKPFPMSLDELFKFVKYPYTGNTSTIKYNAQYVVKTSDILASTQPYDGKSKIYDNKLERVWDLKEV